MINRVVSKKQSTMSYNYLKSNVPNLIKEAYSFIGLKEIVGPQHNPIIIEWAKGLGLGNVYKNDEIPWCGLFVAQVCKQANKEIVKDPLWARNWLNFGTKEHTAMLGDVLVFSRGNGGHVGFYVGEDKKAYHILGGNQGNAVSVGRINKDRCLGIRRSKWKIAQPASVRQIFLSDTGVISENEA